MLGHGGFMKKQHPIGIIFLFLSLFSWASLAETTPAVRTNSGSGVEGVISVSPIHGGPSRAGIPDSKPLANVAFDVANENGTVASFATDDKGRFQVSLPPGHYTVSIKEKRSAIGRYGPFEVDVVADKMTKVQWNCDTGMR